MGRIAKVHMRARVEVGDTLPGAEGGVNRAGHIPPSKLEARHA
jgi:hypothetical protein